MLLLIALISFFSPQPAQAYVLDHHWVLADNRGEAPLMVFSEAKKACPRGTHLPSIREMTKDAQANGARGILEAWQVKEAPEGYVEINAMKSNGKIDHFFFNPSGYRYRDSEEEIGMHYFWTTSPSVEDRNNQYVLGILGHWIFETLNNGEGAAVRCFPNH